MSVRYLPNTAAGVILGVGGHASLWRALSTTDFTRDALGDTAHQLNWFFWLLGVACLGLFTGAYTLKLMRHRDVVLAELHHPVRSHFANMPHIGLLMISLSLPEELNNVHYQRSAWVIAFLMQLMFTQTFYARWMYSDAATLSVARPPYLLSTVGWFLLALLGQTSKLGEAWHLPFEAWTFGVGVAMYVLVVVAVFLGIHNDPGSKGQPALFLLIAPSSVASLVLAGFNGGVFGTASSAVLGYNFLLLVVLVRLGPQLCTAPVLFGTYWAYVFPLAALATSTVKLAADGQSSGVEYDEAPSQVLAWICVAGATAMIAIVFARMSWHAVQVRRGKAEWKDPIAAACDAKRAVAARAAGTGGGVAGVVEVVVGSTAE